MSARHHFVHLGYAVGTGHPVMIPIRHMVVTGQTQESGKTTTLEALIARADLGRRKEERRFRAIAFITKRGEGAFTTGSQVQPYFRTKKADWQYVSSLIDATMGEKNKLLRSFLMKTCRGTATLADVLVNVRHAKDTSKGFPESIYTEIEGYLELVVPQLAQLPPAHKLTLKAGLNVMDVSPYSTELQALVIRATLDHVYEAEEDVVVVIPEAWEFLPEGRGSPVKAAAEALIRKGAALGNFMWLDSQDLAGVWKTAVRACPVALIGVQREANEIKRTLANIHTSSKPKAGDVASLELGEFYACWGKEAVRTYVQPATMPHTQAMAIAKGKMPRSVWRALEPPRRPAPAPPRELAGGRRGGGKTLALREAETSMEPVGSILERVTKTMKPGEERTIAIPLAGRDADAVVDQVKEFVNRGFRAQAAVDTHVRAENIKAQLAAHGSGLTFGELKIGECFYWPPPIPRGPEPIVKMSDTRYQSSGGHGTAEGFYRVERWVDDTKGGETFMSDAAEKKLDQLLERFDGFVTMMNEKYGPGTARVGAAIEMPPPGFSAGDAAGNVLRNPLPERSDRDLEDLADQVADVVIARLGRMVEEGDPRVAVIIRVLTSRSEIHVETKRHIIQENENTQLGRIALLIAEGWFDQKRSPGDVQKELSSRGFNATAPNLNKALKDLAAKGFFTQNNKWFTLVDGVKDRVVRKAS